jgi:uncharacterized membrane protein YesL
MIWQNKNGDFFAVVDRVATFLLANFIWFVLSITIIGIPFATVGLFAVMTKWVQGKQPEFFRVFFEAIREHWQKALIIVMADVVVGALLITNLTILPMMNAGDVLTILSRSITIFVGFVLFMANLYIWPLVTMIDMGINQLNKMVFMLIFTHPFKSAGLLVLALLPIALTLILPRAFLLFTLVSTTAYIASYGTWFILRKQFSPEELENLQFKTIALQNKDIS